MPTPNQQQWLAQMREQVAQAAMQGVPEDELAAQLAQSGAPKPVVDELLAEARRWSPAGEGAMQTALEGVGRGMMRVGRGAANLVGAMDDEDVEEATRLEAPLAGRTAGKVGSFVGETAATLPLGMGATAAVGRAAPWALRGAGRYLAPGAIEGGVSGAVTAAPGERTRGALMGAGFGAATGGALEGAGRATRGLVPVTRAARRLMREGVDVTPGQMAPDSIIGKMETVFEDFPLVGPGIQKAREGARRGFQKAVLAKGAAPGRGAAVSATTPDAALAQAERTFGEAYAPMQDIPSAMGKVGRRMEPVELRTAGGDVPLSSKLNAAAGARGIPATAAEREVVRETLAELTTQLPKNPKLGDLQKLRSDIRSMARDASRANNLERAQLFERADEGITELMSSQLSDDLARQLKATDAKYRIYKLLEDVVYRSGDQPLGFTPQQLSQSIKTAARGTGKGQYARGDDPEGLRRLASAGAETLAPSYAPTGQRTLPGLAMMGAPAGVGAAVASNPLLGATLGAVPPLLSRALVTKPGRQLAAGLHPVQAVARSIIKSAPRPVRELATSLMQQGAGRRTETEEERRRRLARQRRMEG